MIDKIIDTAPRTRGDDPYEDKSSRKEIEMIDVKPEDLNNLPPYAKIAYKFMVKAYREDPISIAMDELRKERARSEKIDNDRKANPAKRSKDLGEAIDILATRLYKLSYAELDDDAKKDIGEMAQRLFPEDAGMIELGLAFFEGLIAASCTRGDDSGTSSS